jgi:endo-1,4-beta-xylanase
MKVSYTQQDWAGTLPRVRVERPTCCRVERAKGAHDFMQASNSRLPRKSPDRTGRWLVPPKLISNHPCVRLGVVTALLLAFSSPVRSADAPVTLKNGYKDHFMVGTAINRSHATGTAGFRRSQELVEKDVVLVKEQFNQITAENDMKWQLIHPREGADGYNFEPADAFVNFGQSNDMYLVGHTLVWHSQTPNWVFAGTIAPPKSESEAEPPRRFRRGYDGPRASREELLERMRNHIHTVVGRYKGKVKAWDVVNEAIADGGPENYLRNSLWMQIIGPDFIAKAFQYAHEADPDAILRYNDYGLENPVKRQKLIKLIKSLQEEGVPIHAIGSQAHVNVATTYETMDQTLANMEALGLPIHITELDVNTAAAGQRGTGANIAENASATQGGLVNDAEKKLADAYAGLFRVFFKHSDSVEMVTFWGVNDGVSWRRFGSPLLFDGDDQPKPAFDAVIAEAGKGAGAK